MKKEEMLNTVRCMSGDLHETKNAILKTLREYLNAKKIYETILELDINQKTHRAEIVEFYNGVDDYGFYLYVYIKNTGIKDVELKVLLSHEKFIITFRNIDNINLLTDFNVDAICSTL